MALAVSPRWAHRRAAYRFAYEALDGTRTRKPRSLVGGTGDSHLTEQALSNLREICRDYGRNNPLVKGLLKVEANGGGRQQHEDRGTLLRQGLQKRRGGSVRERIVESPCDVTGRFAFQKLLRTLYVSYRRDGDALPAADGRRRAVL
jgi:capsid protein